MNLVKSNVYGHGGAVEPQVSHFANFTPCEELVPKRHFCEMCVWSISIIFRGLKSVLKFHIFHIFNCEELVHIRLMDIMHLPALHLF